MASRKLNRRRLLAFTGMACAMAGAGVIGQGGLLPGTAYAADKAAGPLTFVNEASQRLNVMQDSAYRFDALFVDFNSDGCVDAFIVSHSDWGQTSRLWNNRCDGSGTFQYVSPGEGNYYIAGEPLAFWTQRPNERGAAGNSMYALGDIHQRDDQRIRDDALRAYVREAGPGLPLFIAGLVETEVRRQVDDALN